MSEWNHQLPPNDRRYGGRINEMVAPKCAECDQIIWPSEEIGVRVFLWYEGDEADDPLKDELARGGVTHAECADAFSKRIEQPEA